MYLLAAIGHERASAEVSNGILATTLVWATEPWFRAWILILSATAALIAVWRCIALFRRRHRSTADTLVAFCLAELEAKHRGK